MNTGMVWGVDRDGGRNDTSVDIGRNIQKVIQYDGHRHEHENASCIAEEKSLTVPNRSFS